MSKVQENCSDLNISSPEMKLSGQNEVTYLLTDLTASSGVTGTDASVKRHGEEFRSDDDQVMLHKQLFRAYRRPTSHTFV